MIQFINKDSVLITGTCLTQGFYIDIIKALMYVVGHADLELIDSKEIALLTDFISELLPADTQVEMKRCPDVIL